MDKLTAIQVFLSVAETGNFTAAAERLGLSKPMVSRYIALMEEWLGARLLQRTTRKVSLTNAGEQAVVFCRKIANLSEEMQQEIASMQGELRGVVRIACNSVFASSHLLQAVNDFLALHSKLNIQLKSTDILVDLIAEQIDLAVRFTNTPDPHLVARKLAKCRSVLVATPDYLAKSGIPTQPSDLKQHQFLAHINVHHKGLTLYKEGQDCLLELTSRLATNDTAVLLNSTLAHGGIAMLPHYLVAELLQNGTLRAVLNDWQLPTFDVYLLYPSRHRQPIAVRRLIDFLIERFERVEW